MVIRKKTQQSAPTTATPTQTISPVPDLAASIHHIADVIFKALEAPLRAQVEACVQAIVQEATRDIHARIAAEIGRIQPINIPINLFAQTAQSVQPVQPVHREPIPVVVKEEEEEEKEEELDEVSEEVFDENIETETETEEEIEEEIQEVAELIELVELVEVEELEKKKPASPPQVKSIVSAPPALKKSLNITIVGLKPGQAHMIKSEFKFIKLRFIPSDAGRGSKLKDLAKTNDYVVQMTDFLSHSVTDTIKAANSNGNWVYISGGMTKLREKLLELNTNR